MLFKNICGNTCGWKSALKCVKCCLKTENGGLKSLTKHPPSARLDSIESGVCIFASRFQSFFSFFFFLRVNSKIIWFYCAEIKITVHALYLHYSHIVAALFTHLKILKMGPTVLFTHLKIILLQCFQFSIFSFSKISSIQTDP